MQRPPSKLPGVLYGIGLGGFVDGILLHQVLQWHHLVSNDYPTTTVAGLEANTFADGLFHAATWIFVLAASLATLRSWRDGRIAPSYAFHFGGVIMGWGIFNLFDSVVNHHLLGAHHVRDDLGGPLSWDVGFLALAVLLTAAGALMQRRTARRR